MNTHTAKTVLATLLGAAALCGCTSKPEAGQPSSAQTLSAAPAAAAAVPAPPRDATIEAYVATMRADLSAGKVRTINGVMKLTDDEAKVFWPLYQEYESELFDLGDQRVDLIRRFAAAQQSGTIAPADAAALADGFFGFEQQTLDLKKKYYGLIAKELSPVRAAQFTQIEHRVGTIVDLAIAAELPLIK